MTSGTVFLKTRTPTNVKTDVNIPWDNTQARCGFQLAPLADIAKSTIIRRFTAPYKKAYMPNSTYINDLPYIKATDNDIHRESYVIHDMTSYMTSYERAPSSESQEINSFLPFPDPIVKRPFWKFDKYGFKLADGSDIACTVLYKDMTKSKRRWRHRFLWRHRYLGK